MVRRTRAFGDGKVIRRPFFVNVPEQFYAAAGAEKAEEEEFYYENEKMVQYGACAFTGSDYGRSDDGIGG